MIHHKDARGVDPERAILREVQTDRDRVRFVHWGAHQATNAFKDVPNVILAGTLFLPESQYVGLAYASTGIPVGDDIPTDIVNEIQLGEHGHNILQGLCRASVRGSDGSRCRPCNAYIIAAKKSGIREELPTWFPGCAVKTWRPRHKPLKGQVADAVAYLERCVAADPSAPILFGDLMGALAISNKSNFNRKIRKREDFKAAVARLGMEEVTIGTGHYKDAFKRVWDSDPDEAMDGDVWGSHV